MKKLIFVLLSILFVYGCGGSGGSGDGGQPPQVTNSIGMKFNYIPAGTFMMGSPESDTEAQANEKPQHQVTLTKAFYMGVHEVTQGQYKAVMGTNPAYYDETRLGIADSSNYPVEQVSWDDAQLFITALNALEPGVTYRLPTEAEWEYAARAGSTTIYPGGNDNTSLGDYAWYSANSGVLPHPVGQKLPNGWGLYDMHGNVWEWVNDWWQRVYTTAPLSNPSGPDTGSHRLVRGGSWAFNAVLSRAAFRNNHTPSSGYSDLGLRLVREIND